MKIIRNNTIGSQLTSQSKLRENEVANLNLKLSFRRTGLEGSEKFPVIMDFISPKLQTDAY